MQTTLLYGDHDLTIDEKNRLLVPADIRRLLDKERDGEAFFITVGRNRKTWLFPERRYEILAGRMESNLSPDENSLAFDQMMFGMASRAEWDKQGRLLLAEKYRTRTKLGRDVTLVGVRDHLELWNREDWVARFDYLDENRDEITARRRAMDEQNKGPLAAPITLVPYAAGPTS